MFRHILRLTHLEACEQLALARLRLFFWSLWDNFCVEAIAQRQDPDPHALLTEFQKKKQLKKKPSNFPEKFAQICRRT